MAFTPNLWDTFLPPLVQITLHPLESEFHDFRKVTCRIKEGNRRSVSASWDVSRYAAEDSLLLAMSKTITALTVNQERLRAADLLAAGKKAISTYVDPF
jgi:hypothetical protein